MHLFLWQAMDLSQNYIIVDKISIFYKCKQKLNTFYTKKIIPPQDNPTEYYIYIQRSS